jgi:hypothetical protein
MAKGRKEAISEDEEDKFFESGGRQAPEVEESAEEVTETEKVGDEQADESVETVESGQVIKEPPQEQKTVPLAALHEERERRRELQEELRQARLRQQRLEDTWARVQERISSAPVAQQKQEQEVAAPPSYDDDPAGYLRWQQDQIVRQVKSIDDWRQQAVQSMNYQGAQQQFASRVMSHEQSFRAKNPDYDDAVQFIRLRRDQELQSWGVVDPVQRQNIIGQEIMFLADSAIRNGNDPAERAYEIAHTQGYKSLRDDAAAAAESAQKTLEKTTNGQQKISTIKKGQQAAKSLSNVGGNSPENLTLQSLADIEDLDEFDRQWEKLFGGGRRLF